MGKCLVLNVDGESIVVANGSQHLNRDRVGEGRVMSLAFSDHTSHIEQVQLIARRNSRGHHAYKALQCASFAKHSEKHIPNIDLGQTSAGKLEIAICDTLRER